MSAPWGQGPSLALVFCDYQKNPLRQWVLSQFFINYGPLEKFQGTKLYFSWFPDS